MAEFSVVVLAWWHRVTVLRVRREQTAESLDLADCDNIGCGDCFPVGALECGEEVERDSAGLDLPPPDC